MVSFVETPLTKTLWNNTSAVQTHLKFNKSSCGYIMKLNQVLLCICTLFSLCQCQREPTSFLLAGVNLSPRTCFVLIHVSGFFNSRVMLQLRAVNLETSPVLTSNECLLPELRTNMLFPFLCHHKLMTAESWWKSGALNWSERSSRGERLMIPTHPTCSWAVELACGLNVLYGERWRSIHPSTGNHLLVLIRDVLGTAVYPSSYWWEGGRYPEQITN